MPTLDLATEKPVAGTSLDANQVASGFTEIQAAVNGLDANNWAAGKIFAPSKITQEAAITGSVLTWNGTDWVPANSIAFARTAALTVLENKLLAADAQPAVRVLGSGKIEWGAGGASALDTNLYRLAADFLKTDDSLDIGGIAFRLVNSGGSMYVRSAASPALAWLLVSQSGDAFDRFVQNVTGQMNWGPGSAALDVSLARKAVDVLGLDAGDGFQFEEAAADLPAPAANQVRLYAKDVAGKTALFARFATGAVQQIAIEP